MKFNSNTIGFFGEAFSPIHRGHIEMINNVIELNLVENVIIVPATDYYKKEGVLPADIRLTFLYKVLPYMSNAIVSVEFCQVK